MKKIDIDQLPKKNTFKLPENTFEVMQSRVLAEINKEEHNQQDIQIGKPAKTFSIGWKYASAAAILLLFGLSFLWFGNLGNTDTSKDIASKVDSSFNVQNYDSHLAVKNQSDEEILEEIYAHVEEPQTKTSNTIVEKDKKKSSIKPAKIENEEDLDVLLSVYSSHEIAKLSKEAEQDVYLDIFY